MIQCFFFCISLCVWLCVCEWGKEREQETETEKRRHGCHSNCVIMLVAIMKAMKTGKGRGLAQKRRREKNSPTLKRERKLSIRFRSTSGGAQGRLEVQVMRSDERWWSVEDASNTFVGWTGCTVRWVRLVPDWFQSNASSSSLSSSSSAAAAICQPSYRQKNDYTIRVLTPNCIC